MENIKLNLAVTTESRQFASKLDKFRKDEIMDTLRPLKRALLKTDITYKTSSRNKDSEKAFEQIVSSGVTSVNKDKICAAAGSLATHADNYVELCKVVPGLRDVWLRLIGDIDISSDEVAKILGRKIVAYSTANSWNPLLVTDAMFYPTNVASHSSRQSRYSSGGVLSKFDLYLPYRHRKEMALAFLGTDALKVLKVSELPDGLVTESFETDAAIDFNYLDTLHKCGELLTENNQNITQVKLNAIDKKLTTGSFKSKSDTLLSRHRLFAATCAEYFIRQNNRRRGEDTIDFIGFAKYVTGAYGTILTTGGIQALLPAYKGFLKSSTGNCRARFIAPYVISLITEKDEVWVSLANFKLRYLCGDKLLSPDTAYTGLFDPRAYKSFNLRGHKSSTYEKMPLPNLWKDITFPFVIHFIKLLCACGIVELAYDPTAPEDDELEGLRYAKLTSLGRYALGYTDEYKAPATTDTKDVFDFDDQNHIITLLDSGSPYRVFLDQIGRYIGGNRFHVTSASIVEGASDKSDVNRKIESFTKFICPNPKGYWKELIDEVEKRSNVKCTISKDYILLRLNPEVEGLMEFVARNAEIAKHSLKAEDFHLIVEDDFYDQFVKILRSGGYML